MNTATEFQNAIPQRIDRLPLNKVTWSIMFMAGIAWLIESYDIGIMGNALPLLAQQYHIDSFEKGLLTTISTLGIVIAVVPAGWLADRIGRKKILVVGTAWYAFFSLLCGFAPNIPALIILRFISGLGMGAVFPIPYAMAAEMISQRYRGIVTAVLESFLSFGYFLAPVCALALMSSQSLNSGWRILFYIGGIPLIYVPILLKWMPESPRWLQTKGRVHEAHDIVYHLEHSVENAGKQLAPLQFPTNGATEYAPVLRKHSIFDRTYLKRTLMMWVSFACILMIFYIIQTYTPSVLVQQGYGITNAFLLTSIIVVASIPGKYCAGLAMERFGRKPTLITFTLIAALCALLFGFAHNVTLALISGCVMSFFGIGADPAIKIYNAEQYPTSIRETGISTTEGVGRLIGGVFAPFIMSFTLTSVGIPGSYIFMACIAVIGAIVVALFGSETRGKTLEEATGTTDVVLTTTPQYDYTRR